MVLTDVSVLRAKMAVDGSRWQVLERSLSRLAQTSAVENEFFRRVAEPNSLSKACESTMMLNSLIWPMNGTAGRIDQCTAIGVLDFA